MFKIKYMLHRLTHWEYWPSWTIYLPLSFYFLYLSIKAKSFGFFNASNPAIKYGGMTLELKSEIKKIIPNNLHPNTIVIYIENKEQIVRKLLMNNEVVFPCIVKPDDGCQGKNVTFIEEENALLNYTKAATFNFLIQEYIDLPNEIGLFYCRYPNQSVGFISGIVEKKMITVIGDGTHTIGQLINSNYRYHKFYDELFEKNKSLKNQILRKNATVVLSKIGNHARGATFFDRSNLITTPLINTFNIISKQIDGFYYGRFDIKYNTWEELCEGKNFKIIELNGAGSEPTHMYDPKHSYFFALKEIMKHWNWMYEIAVQNKQKGVRFLSIGDCLILLISYFKS